ncbi:ABC transporter ATP-binding protein [Kibdelosporangium phytohabitans]|uniref:Multidrug ABC transporter ATP-binding protein n=1 Tax=Kibdelosporangium phytohabitans TaxID=860235 RepID=A0A0N9IET2_9PSEU|nr:ABC transporter ATP-binding protein [Kibdelosporangium phytohabitans]ALG14974.1 multidrug ABC transporter ATP-binding protein [Kibdelosporangium phytohabitans]MBE1469464.1 ATP-binding cassette subfamily B protein [Kibdelosporangium phytohabitans]
MLNRLLVTYLRPYRGELTIVLVLQLVGTIASLLLPSLNADIIDNGVARGDNDYILMVGGWMLAVSLVQIACSIVAVKYGARMAMAFGRDVRAGIFHRVGEFSGREVAAFGAPSLITRTTNDVQQVQILVVMMATMFVTAPIMCVAGIVMALREDFGLSWLLLVCVPVLVISIGLIVSRMVPQFRFMQDRIDQVNRVLREQLTGIRVVRAFVREKAETQRFGDANDQLTDTARRVGRLQAMMFPTVMLILNVSSVAVLWFGSYRVDSGEMQIGALTAFLSYLVQILAAVMMATFISIMIPRAAVCAERIMEVIDTEPSVRPPTTPVTDLPARAEVVFDEVEFRYPGAADPVLRGVTLRAEAGKTTAIVGSTGSGKTTLINLIPRFIDVTAGRITVNGTDVRDLDPEVLRRRIGLVPQQAYLFTGTVRSNLRYGNPDATDEQLWTALEIAQARGFVEEMGGLDSTIAQGGTNVSGGQRQRLSIARALVREPEVYLFDDAFSALDLATDAALRAALRPRTERAAVIVVAQRVSTVLDADRIVVLENGEIVGSGTHRELMAACPTYVEIVESQLTPEQAA